MNAIFLALAAIFINARAWGAIGYSSFTPKNNDFIMEYPSDWKRSFGILAVALQPPGRDGADVKISLEQYPLGKNSPPTPNAFIKRLMGPVGKIKKLESRKKATAAGLAAERLTFTETVDLKDQYGNKLPGPLREIFVVVLAKRNSYYVLKIQGVGEAFDRNLPEFNRIAEKLRILPDTKP